MSKITKDGHETESKKSFKFKKRRRKTKEEIKATCEVYGIEYKEKIKKTAGRAVTWTPQEINAVIELNEQGYTYGEIGKLLSRSYRTIMRIMKGNGIQYNGSRGQKVAAKARREQLEHDYESMLADFYAGHSYEIISEKYGYKKYEVEQHFRKQVGKRNYTRITDEEKDTIRHYYGGGCTVACIARRLGRSREGIDSFIKTEALDVEEIYPDHNLIRDLNKTGLTPEQIAAKLELPTVTVKHNLAKIPKLHTRHRYFAPSDDKKMLRLRADGYSVNEIAKKLKRTKDSVRSRLRRLRDDE